jgi:hypothetical protein
MEQQTIAKRGTDTGLNSARKSPRRKKKYKSFLKQIQENKFGVQLYSDLDEILGGKSHKKKFEAQKKIDKYKKVFIDKINKEGKKT